MREQQMSEFPALPLFEVLLPLFKLSLPLFLSWWAPSVDESSPPPPHLSATVLDRGLEDLNNLYKTISRKRILSKVL